MRFYEKRDINCIINFETQPFTGIVKTVSWRNGVCLIGILLFLCGFLQKINSGQDPVKAAFFPVLAIVLFATLFFVNKGFSQIGSKTALEINNGIVTAKKIRGLINVDITCPLSAYSGVGIYSFIITRKMPHPYYVVELSHPDSSKNIPLFSCENEKELAIEKQNEIAEILGLETV